MQPEVTLTQLLDPQPALKPKPLEKNKIIKAPLITAKGPKELP